MSGRVGGVRLAQTPFPLRVERRSGAQRERERERDERKMREGGKGD